MKSREKNGRDSRTRETKVGEKIAVTNRHRFNLGFYAHIFWECPHINRPLYTNVIFARIEIDELY